jgi:hypothetical protein
LVAEVVVRVLALVNQVVQAAVVVQHPTMVARVEADN